METSERTRKNPPQPPHSDAFWEWFENGGITDDEGNPKVFYRGEVGEADLEGRQFVTADPEIASEYANRAAIWVAGAREVPMTSVDMVNPDLYDEIPQVGQTVTPVFVRADRVADLTEFPVSLSMAEGTFSSGPTVEVLEDHLGDLGVDIEIDPEFVPDYVFLPPETTPYSQITLYFWLEQLDIYRDLQEAGYDAARIEDASPTGRPHETFVVFDPGDVRPAFGRRANPLDDKLDVTTPQDRRHLDKGVEFTDPDAYATGFSGEGQNTFTREGVEGAKFRQWFGDWTDPQSDTSVVTDEDGKPLKVYHGTTDGGFNRFMVGDELRERGSPGVFFTDSRSHALSYSGSREEIVPQIVGPAEVTDPNFGFEVDVRRKEMRAYEVLDGERTVDVVEERERDFEETLDEYAEQGYQIEETRVDRYDVFHRGVEILANGTEDEKIAAVDAIVQAVNARAEIPPRTGAGVMAAYLNVRDPMEVDFEGRHWDDPPEDFPALGIDDLVAFARRTGYDGVIIRNIHDPGGQTSSAPVADEYIVFDADQVAVQGGRPDHIAIPRSGTDPRLNPNGSTDESRDPFAQSAPGSFPGETYREAMMESVKEKYKTASGSRRGMVLTDGTLVPTRGTGNPDEHGEIRPVKDTIPPDLYDAYREMEGDEFARSLALNMAGAGRAAPGAGFGLTSAETLTVEFTRRPTPEQLQWLEEAITEEAPGKIKIELVRIGDYEEPFDTRVSDYLTFDGHESMRTIREAIRRFYDRDDGEADSEPTASQMRRFSNRTTLERIRDNPSPELTLSQRADARRAFRQCRAWLDAWDPAKRPGALQTKEFLEFRYQMKLLPIWEIGIDREFLPLKVPLYPGEFKKAAGFYTQNFRKSGVPAIGVRVLDDLDMGEPDCLKESLGTWSMHINYMGVEGTLKAIRRAISDLEGRGLDPSRTSENLWDRKLIEQLSRHLYGIDCVLDAKQAAEAIRRVRTYSDTLAQRFEQRRSSFLHEFQHHIDVLRTEGRGVYDTEDKELIAGLPSKDWFEKYANAAMEVNARLQEALDSFEQEYLTSRGAFEKLRDEDVGPRWVVSEVQDRFGSWDALRQDTRQQVLKRIYSYYDQIIRPRLARSNRQLTYDR